MYALLTLLEEDFCHTSTELRVAQSRIDNDVLLLVRTSRSVLIFYRKIKTRCSQLFIVEYKLDINGTNNVWEVVKLDLIAEEDFY